MNCFKMQVLLPVYMDRPKDPEAEAHLESCPQCRAVQKDYETLRPLIRSNRVEGAPFSSHADRIAEHILSPAPRPRKSIFRPALTAAAVLLIAWGVFSLLRSYPGESPSVPRPFIPARYAMQDIPDELKKYFSFDATASRSLSTKEIREMLKKRQSLFERTSRNGG